MIDRAALVMARRTLEAVTGRTALPPVSDFPGAKEPARVFVTIRVRGRLRGCIGDTSGGFPFGNLVVRMTEAAATRDPRFEPVTARELSETRIAVCRLTEPEPITLGEIEIGRHGLVVSHDARRGLLLPSVATEFGVDPNGFVKLACRKAGLPVNMARDPALFIEGFEVEVISE